MSSREPRKATGRYLVEIAIADKGDTVLTDNGEGVEEVVVVRRTTDECIVVHDDQPGAPLGKIGVFLSLDEAAAIEHILGDTAAALKHTIEHEFKPGGQLIAQAEREVILLMGIRNNIRAVREISERRS